ncbi:MAG: PAS-domain containing protein [Alphaproteobacteria bacterium]|nr:PAS-domain containing protein [Alphaproteobacteria bacterium]
MLKQLLTKAPVWAVLVAVLIFVIVASAALGLEWPLLVSLAATIFAIAEGVALWTLSRKQAQNERHFRQIRFIADRLQSMVRTMPGGYCLFTPQGMLREEHGVATCLNVEKISHLDDLIGAIKEGPDLLGAFRRLQLSGAPFTMAVHAAKGDTVTHVMGRQFRIGGTGPVVDVLWFCDHIQGVVHQAAVAAAMTTEVHAATVAKEDKVEVILIEPEQLTKKSTNLGSCFDVLPFPVWARSEDLRLVMCNAAYADALDTTIDAVLSGQLELMPASSKGGRALAEAALKKQEPLAERDHVVIKGKRCLLQVAERPVSGLHAVVLAGENEQQVVLLGLALDVTAEEDKETELRRHLVSHHEVMEHLGAAICVYGADTRLEFYNRAYQRLWEAQESFLDSKPTFSEILEDLRARRRIPEQADFQKFKKERLALFTSLLESREDVMYLPDGTSLRILAAPHPLGGLMFVHENVTDQLELETSYNTLMAVQKETLDNLAEGIAVFGPDGRLRLSNPAFIKLWHLSPEFVESDPHVSEVLDQAKGVLDTSRDWAAFKTEMVGYALDRTPRSGRIEHTDHTVVDFITVPLPDGAVLNSFLNVTDSVKVEQALRASNIALATADRLKSDFVANVSYQLRTPLNTIMGFADILAEQYFGQLNDRQLEYTTTIKSESEKLSRLINDVLDLATIEAGRMTLDCHPVSVANVLNEAKLMTAAWARQQMIDILIDCPSDIGVMEADEHRVKQVLFNLISNAIKYTPAGGNIALAAWKQDAWIVISVLDTGVGIPESDRDRVFGKFEKSNSHLRQAGAGLGLSLVKSFVEMHGGRVEIFSDDKDGTRVSCFFPQTGAGKNVAAHLLRA